jgi:hypothetical protein
MDVAANTSNGTAVGNASATEQPPWVTGFPLGQPPLVQAHVTCMCLAAPMVMATAIIAAHGQFKPWWFQAHITMAMASAGTTAVGFGCILAHIEREGSGHFRTTHHTVGVVLVVTMAFHILLAAMRPRAPAADAGKAGSRHDGPSGPASSSSAAAALGETGPRKLWRLFHSVTGFPVLCFGFIYQVVYSGHVTLLGHWAFPLNALLLPIAGQLKMWLEAEEKLLHENELEDRENDMANPLMEPGGGGGGGGGEEQQGEGVAELVLCPDITANIQSFYANVKTGGLSPLILLGLFNCSQMLPHMILGNFFLPSIVEAYEYGDALMFGGMCIFTIFGMVAVPLWLLETRRTVNPVIDGGPGYLSQLGVGRVMLTPRQARSIRGCDQFHPLNPHMVPPNILPPAVIALLILITGAGIRSEPWMNRVSGLLNAMFMLCTRPLVGCYIMTLSIACKLASFQVAAVSAAIRNFPTGKSGSAPDWEKWEADVVEPIRGLVSTMQILTDGWGRGMAAISFAGTCMLLAQTCILLSPMTDTLDHFGENTPLYVRISNVIFITLFGAIPFILARQPAQVSTSCEDLLESLNAIRLANPLSVEVDERVTILEKCLTNVNRGQGIGFKVFDIVISRKVLTRVFLQIFASITFLAPIMLSLSRGENTYNRR